MSDVLEMSGDAKGCLGIMSAACFFIGACFTVGCGTTFLVLGGLAAIGVTLSHYKESKKNDRRSSSSTHSVR